MLCALQIANFAIIEQLTLEFLPLMTAFTGETGAGKSIIIDALELALGTPATPYCLRPGSEALEINARFTLPDNAMALRWLIEHELDDGNDCNLRRTINSQGQSRCYINGQPVRAQLVKELSDKLIRVQSQNVHQELLKTNVQREILDSFADNSILLEQISQLVEQWQNLAKQKQTIEQLQQEQNTRSELLNYQLQELNSIQSTLQALSKLEEEYASLAHAEKILSIGQQIRAIVDVEQNGNILLQIKMLSQYLQQLAPYSNKINDIINLVTQAQVQLTESSSDINNYLYTIEIDPERKAALEQQLQQVYDIARKYKTTPEELASLLEKLQGEFDEIAAGSTQISELTKQMDALVATYHTASQQLTKARQKKALVLSQNMTKLMQELGMQGGQFSVSLTPHQNDTLNKFGCEQVGFLVTTNPGQPLQPLAKVVSGGELARLSLALASLNIQKQDNTTLIFDEVDTGIGGATASMVGKLLKRLSKTQQLFCVTHLPQVAAMADNQISVVKKVIKQQTYLDIHILNKESRVDEIARMLGGIQKSEQSRAHAKELLDY